MWYNFSRPFADQNLHLARLLYTSALARLQSAGYTPVERGLKDDANFRVWRGVAYGIFVLGGERPPRHVRATRMPGVLGELLFLSNPVEGRLLRQEEIRRAIADAYADAAALFLDGEG